MSKNGFGKQGSALLRRRWLARAQKRNSAETERTQGRRADGPALSAQKADIAERVRRRWDTDETQTPRTHEETAQTMPESESKRPARAAGCDGCACTEQACAAHGCCEFVRCARKETSLQWDKS